MLNFTDLALRRGQQLLFEGVTLCIHSGWKAGVTGANGCGKSSLFALVRGELHADGGDFSLPPKTVIAHVAQETPAVDTPAIDYVMDGDQELRDIEAALVRAEQAGDGPLLARLHARLEAVDGYTARSRAARLMDGLGFTTDQEQTPVREFSGGWRMRLNLARALMCRSDLLLLDEPTNHLDLDAVIWLEDWLRAYHGTLLLISHDRDFLDRVTDHILHIEQRGARLYNGNYSSFERSRAEMLAQQQAAYTRQQKEIAHIRSFVDRFRAKATKARQAQSRINALERMQLIAPAHVDSPFHFGFRPPEKLMTPLLGLKKVAVGYGEQPILERVDLSLAPGDRVGLLGPNGAGKSTLIKLLAGELAPMGGKREPSPALKLGYFAQHQLEQLRGDDTPLSHLQRLDPDAKEQELRDYLGGFGFPGDKALGVVAPLSGGEKARLVLALLIYQRPNLLLLDEPTNHLDLEMRHALGLALQEFQGAMVIVSHDRHLLRLVCDELLLVADGRVDRFPDSVDDYPRWLAEYRSQEQRKTSTAQTPNTGAPPTSAAARKDQRRLEAENRRALQPLRNRLRRLEADMEKLGERKNLMETQLADPAIYQADAKEQLKKLLADQAGITTRLAAAEEEWLQIHEEIEDAQPPQQVA